MTDDPGAADTSDHYGFDYDTAEHGFVAANCVCGWRGSPVSSTDDAADDYGEYRAAAALRARDTELAAARAVEQRRREGWEPGIPPNQAEWMLPTGVVHAGRPLFRYEPMSDAERAWLASVAATPIPTAGCAMCGHRWDEHSVYGCHHPGCDTDCHPYGPWPVAASPTPKEPTLGEAVMNGFTITDAETGEWLAGPPPKEPTDG